MGRTSRCSTTRSRGPAHREQRHACGPHEQKEQEDARVRRSSGAARATHAARDYLSVADIEQLRDNRLVCGAAVGGHSRVHRKPARAREAPDQRCAAVSPVQPKVKPRSSRSRGRRHDHTVNGLQVYQQELARTDGTDPPARRVGATSRVSRTEGPQLVPELPKPPAPRAVPAKLSTTSSATCTIGTMTIGRSATGAIV